MTVHKRKRLTFSKLLKLLWVVNSLVVIKYRLVLWSNQVNIREPIIINDIKKNKWLVFVFLGKVTI